MGDALKIDKDSIVVRRAPHDCRLRLNETFVSSVWYAPIQLIILIFLVLELHGRGTALG